MKSIQIKNCYNYLQNNKKRKKCNEKNMEKIDMGSRDIGDMINEKSEKFDRRKFGKMECKSCGHKFNPFYTKTLKCVKDWGWIWKYEHKEPEKEYKCKCPKCYQELFFRIYLGQ